MDLIDALSVRQGHTTQGEFAALVGISETTLSRIYSGERQIGEETARRIARAFPSLQYLVMGYLMTKNDDTAK
ncbi:MAG: helix-turn-helix transcriptional regulator [Dehalococcoidia bacterium]|nr:helix-turn-helix transcriptional regulator [Dehalococcoidia bacterium]